MNTKFIFPLVVFNVIYGQVVAVNLLDSLFSLPSSILPISAVTTLFDELFSVSGVVAGTTTTTRATSIFKSSVKDERTSPAPTKSTGNSTNALDNIASVLLSWLNFPSILDSNNFMAQSAEIARQTAALIQTQADLLPEIAKLVSAVDTKPSTGSRRRQLKKRRLENSPLLRAAEFDPLTILYESKGEWEPIPTEDEDLPPQAGVSEPAEPPLSAEPPQEQEGTVQPVEPPLNASDLTWHGVDIQLCEYYYPSSFWSYQRACVKFSAPTDDFTSWEDVEKIYRNAHHIELIVRKHMETALSSIRCPNFYNCLAQPSATSPLVCGQDFSWMSRDTKENNALLASAYNVRISSAAFIQRVFMYEFDSGESTPPLLRAADKFIDDLVSSRANLTFSDLVIDLRNLADLLDTYVVYQSMEDDGLQYIIAEAQRSLYLFDEIYSSQSLTTMPAMVAALKTLVAPAQRIRRLLASAQQMLTDIRIINTYPGHFNFNKGKSNFCKKFNENKVKQNALTSFSSFRLSTTWTQAKVYFVHTVIPHALEYIDLFIDALNATGSAEDDTVAMTAQVEGAANVKVVSIDARRRYHNSWYFETTEFQHSELKRFYQRMNQEYLDLVKNSWHLIPESSKILFY